MIGKKVYYELSTGDVILIVPEKHAINATNTTKEQDFQMYDVLSARNPDTIGCIQLEYRQYESDFQSANSVKVDLETGQLKFSYPVFEEPLSILVNNLKSQNTQLASQVMNMTAKAQTQQTLIDDLTLQLGDALLGGAL
jgi:hypothetical protein